MELDDVRCLVVVIRDAAPVGKGLDCRTSTYLATESVVVVVERRVAELGRWCISRPSTPGMWVMVGLWDR